MCLVFVLQFRIIKDTKDVQLTKEDIQLIKSEKIEEKDKNTDVFSAKVKLAGYIIEALYIDDMYYLFIPKNVDISDLIINYNVDIVSTTLGQIDKENKIIINDFTQNNEITLTSKDNLVYKIKVMQSDVPSICINLDDVTLEQVNSRSKNIKYEAHLKIMGADEEKYNIADKTIEIKGRGNSTWTLDKKPYQIKFKEEENLLGINGKSKKWILLANYFDKTFLRNKLSFDLQRDVGLSDSLNGTFVDLYINGEFLGNYTLSDKVDIGESRVNLKDSKGLIVEMDLAYGNKESNKFKTELTDTTFVIKESVSEEDSEDYKEAVKDFENSINKLEKLLYDENASWNEISELIDVDSFLKYYLLLEFSEEPDFFKTSTFFYKDGIEDVIHIGPVWDADLAFDNFKIKYLNAEVDYILNIEKYRGDFNHNWYEQLYEHKEFVKLLNEMYQQEIYSVISNVPNKIDEYVNGMQKSVEMNLVRWHNHLNMDDYYIQIQNLKKYIHTRTEYLNGRYSINSSVIYNTCVKEETIEGAWESTWKMDGQSSGLTDGSTTSIQDIKITLANSKKNQNIKYDVYVEGKDWHGWKYNGNDFAIANENNIEAIKIELEGMPEYKVAYRVYMKDSGWQEWKYDGEIAGAIDCGQLIQGIEIKIEKI